MRPDCARDVCGGHCDSLKRREVELAGLSTGITVDGVDYDAHPASTLHADQRLDRYEVCKSPQPHRCRNFHLVSVCLISLILLVVDRGPAC
jgi:hypothetical protein